MMKKRRKVIERAKTVFIVVLAVSAVGLAFLTGMFDQFFGGDNPLKSVFGKNAGRSDLPLVSNEETVGVGEAALPVFAAVTSAEGVHYAVKYSAAELREVYDDTGTVFSEAIGSANSEKEIDEAEWQKALGLPGIYYDYLNPLPLSAISSWFGVEVNSAMGERQVRRLCLAASEETIKLYYEDAAEESFYCCATAVKPSSIAAYFVQYLPNGAKFAFEAGEACADAEPYTLLLAELALPDSYKASNPVSGAISSENIISVFGINPYSSYSESDGTRVFIENSCSLRIGTDGTVVYTSSEEEGALSGEFSGLDGAVEYARGIAEETIAKSSGAAEVYLVSAQYVRGAYVLDFGYFINSVPVYIGAEANAMRIVLEDGRVSYAKLCFRSYEPLGEPCMIYSDEHAAAAANDGKEPVLCYVDLANQNVQTSWTIA